MGETKVLKLCEKCKKHNHNITYAMCFYCKEEGKRVQEAFSKAEGKENTSNGARMGMLMNNAVQTAIHVHQFDTTKDFRTLLSASFDIVKEVMEEKERKNG